VRDFSNLAFHNILDWRLGLDLARLALDATAPIDFNVAYWQALAVIVSNAHFDAQPGWQNQSFAGVPAGRRSNHVQIVTHPLWIRDRNNPPSWCPALTNAHAAAAASGATRIDFRTLFDVLRRRRCVVQGTSAGICAHWFELPQRKHRTIIGLEPGTAGSDLSTLAPQTGQFA